MSSMATPTWSAARNARGSTSETLNVLATPHTQQVQLLYSLSLHDIAVNKIGLNQTVFLQGTCVITRSVEGISMIP